MQRQVDRFRRRWQMGSVFIAPASRDDGETRALQAHAQGKDCFKMGISRPGRSPRGRLFFGSGAGVLAGGREEGIAWERAAVHQIVASASALRIWAAAADLAPHLTALCLLCAVIAVVSAKVFKVLAIAAAQERVRDGCLLPGDELWAESVSALGWAAAGDGPPGGGS